MDAFSFFLFALGVFLLVIVLPVRDYVVRWLQMRHEQRAAAHAVLLEAYKNFRFPEQRQQIIEDIIMYTQTVKHQRALIRQQGRRYDALPGFVYLMCINKEYYKIGYARNVAKRLIDLQVASPYTIDVVHVIATQHTLRLESLLHQRYVSKQINGEWFALDLEDVASICSIASPVTIIDLSEMEREHV